MNQKGEINKKKKVEIKKTKQIHNSLLQPMNVTLSFILEKDIEVTLLRFIERLQGRAEGTNKQVTGVCIDLLLSTVVMSLNTGYGLY